MEMFNSRALTLIKLRPRVVIDIDALITEDKIVKKDLFSF